MGPDFLYCVISSVDGERDPNNLILLFRILPQFLKNFPLGHLAEETFDVIACYFPIDFHEVKLKFNTNYIIYIYINTNYNVFFIL